MRVLQVLNFKNLYGGGLTESVPTLCHALADCGAKVRLVVPRARPEWDRLPVELYDCSLNPSRSRFSVRGTMSDTIERLASEAQVIHCHDVWSHAAVQSARAARSHGSRLLYSTRGVLSSAAMNVSRWKKRLAWPLRRPLLNAADCIHVTSDAERRDVRSRRLQPPVALIPNAISLDPSHDGTGERNGNYWKDSGARSPHEHVRPVEAWSGLFVSDPRR